MAMANRPMKKQGSTFVRPWRHPSILLRTFASRSSIDGKFAEVNGVVEKVLFRAATGYTVAKLRMKGIDMEHKNIRGVPKIGKLMTIVSSTCPLMATTMVGDDLVCKGRWTENDKWGIQMEVESSSLQDLMHTSIEMGNATELTEGATRAWLTSGKLKGVGPKIADRMIQAFGADTQQVLNQLGEEGFDYRLSPLNNVSGIGSKLIKSMAESIRQSGSSRLHVQQLLELRIPLATATKMADYWRATAVDKCKEDFHATLLECDRTSELSFSAADVIARSLGCSDSASGRSRHAISSTLYSLTWQSGHCMVPLRELIKTSLSLCLHRKAEVELTEDELLKQIIEMSNRHFLSLQIKNEPDKKVKLTKLNSALIDSCVVFPGSLNEAEMVVGDAISLRCRMLLEGTSSEELETLRSRVKVYGEAAVYGELENLKESLKRRKKELSSLMKQAEKGKVESQERGRLMSDSHSVSSYNLPKYLESSIAEVSRAVFKLQQEVSLNEQALHVGELYPWESKYPAGWHQAKQSSDLTLEWDPNNAGKSEISNALKSLGISPTSPMRHTLIDSTSVDGSSYSSKMKMIELAKELQEKYGGNLLSLVQAQAVDLAIEEQVLLLSGGPGVGKTETVRAIVKTLDERGERVMLACPTARAAQVLERVTGKDVTTIHRLLEWAPHKHVFEKNSFNKLNADTVIIDECSMLDIDLAAHLFRALKPATRVILVGDQDQLPPVGPGSMYRDLMACRCVPRVVLTEIFRQRSDGSGSQDIARNAQEVNSGKVPSFFRHQMSFCDLDEDYDDYKMEHEYLMDSKAELFEAKSRDSAGSVDNGCVMLMATDEHDAADQLLDAVAELLLAGRQPSEIQVLAPMKRGACGTLALNERLQNLLNPNHQTGQKIAVGDRVLQLVNDYDRNVFNGDMGIVASADMHGFSVHFAKGEESATHNYKLKDLNILCSLSYAITVHKAQGSEYPVVLLPLVKENRRMLQRTLLYTAMSRAKELLVMVCSLGVVQHCVKKVDTLGRRTNLRARVESKMKRAGDPIDTSTKSTKAPKTPEVSKKIPTISKPFLESTQEFDFGDLPF